MHAKKIHHNHSPFPDSIFQLQNMALGLSSGMVKLNSLHSESEIISKRNKRIFKLFPWEFSCSRELYKMLSQNSLVALHKTSVTVTKALTSLIDHQ